MASAEVTDAARASTAAAAPTRPSAERRTRAARVALAAGGGFLVALALPPWGFWPLAFLGVAAFEYSLGAHPDRRPRAARAFAFAWVWMAMGMGWMWQLTAPGYVVATLVFAGLHTLAALVAPGGRWRVIGRPAAHALVEAIRFSFPFGGVPLASLGISQAGGPVLSVAGVIGVIGVTWFVFQVGFALAGPAPASPVRVRGRAAAGGSWLGLAALAACALLFVISLVAPDGRGTGRMLDIAAVQGGGEQGTRAIDVPSRIVTERHLEATRTIEPDPDLDLVVWPENVIDINREPFEGSAVMDEVVAEAARLGVPISVGITEDADVTGRGVPGQITNAQVVLSPEGELVSRYDKVRRVPFGEYVPLRTLLEAVGAPVDQVPSNAVAGTEPAVIELPDGTSMATVISWEVFFGGRAREGVLAGGELVLNPTNGASYTGTILQTQQVASSRLRAVETGRWVIQVSPTGFSAFVTPTGEVLERTAVGERAVIRGTVELRTGRTWATLIGDGPVIAALLLALGASIVLSRRAVASTESVTPRSASVTPRSAP